jgi:hypothetical protein
MRPDQRNDGGGGPPRRRADATAPPTIFPLYEGRDFWGLGTPPAVEVEGGASRASEWRQTFLFHRFTAYFLEALVVFHILD